MKRLLISAVVACASLVGVSANAETVRVGAAISLTDALTAVAKDYEAAGDKVEFVFGSSGQIQKQIESGAPIDLFISAADKQVDELAAKHLVEVGSRRVIATNTLVLVVPTDAKAAPRDFAGLANENVTRIAIGEPTTVPAGDYAAQVLQSLNLTAAVQNKLVYGANVRQVLSYVERGEVSAGVVYATDAKASGDKVRVVAAAPPESHKPIVYPAVLVSGANKPAARRFLDHLGTPKAQAQLVALGFDVPSAAPPATNPMTPPAEGGR